MTEARILILSDVHLCSLNWYGRSSRDRLQKMAEDIRAFFRVKPFSGIFLLGDYSLDFWGHLQGGSWLNERRSDTKRFVEEFASQFPTDYYMLPGNHEQYSLEDWQRITGFPREYAVVCNEYLFIMLDNYSGILNPDRHSDGVYSQTNVAYIRRSLQEHPGLPVILCAHYFDMARESEEFKNLLRDELRIVCLFCGHDHRIQIEELGERCGWVSLVHAGHYSYAGSGTSPYDVMWGFEEVILSEQGIQVTYVEPSNVVEWNGHRLKHSYREQLKKVISNRSLL